MWNETQGWCITRFCGSEKCSQMLCVSRGGLIWPPSFAFDFKMIGVTWSVLNDEDYPRWGHRCHQWAISKQLVPFQFFVDRLADHWMTARAEPSYRWQVERPHWASTKGGGQSVATAASATWVETCHPLGVSSLNGKRELKGTGRFSWPQTHLILLYLIFLRFYGGIFDVQQTTYIWSVQFDEFDIGIHS